jgi:hypothetical protein
VANRVVERRRAVALARHYREAERLSIAQITGRLGRLPATIKAYVYAPTGETVRAAHAVLRVQRIESCSSVGKGNRQKASVMGRKSCHLTYVGNPHADPRAAQCL